jgi:von Willebrand factor type A domain
VNEGTAPELGFSIEIDVADGILLDADRVDALITIAAHPTGRETRAAQTAEILIMDRSLSMDSNNKMDYARRAACAAIDILPDGTFFGIVGGNDRAEQVFPVVGGLVRADAAMKAAARQQVMSLWPKGGTKIGQWLTAANEFSATGPASGVIRHAVLYSDGKNEHETREELDEVLRACTDHFICDVRGVGEDWNYAELLHIATTLGGDAQAVIDVADLPGDFADCMRRAARLVVPRAYLRLQPDSRFQVESVMQTNPVQADLWRSQRRVSETVIEIPLGPWKPDTRCYQLTLCFEPDSLPVADYIRATPVELVVETAEGKLEQRADAALVVRRLNVAGGITAMPHLRRLTMIAKARELTATITACVTAWDAGLSSDADDELDRAIRLATELEDDVRLSLLESVATRRPDGRARLRHDAARGDMLKLGMNSTKTGAPPAQVVSPSPTSGLSCRECGETTYGADLSYCERCGASLNAKAEP